MDENNHIIESEFIHEGLKCIVIFTSYGHRCGYVSVEENSPLFGIGYSDDLNKPELLKELKQTTIGKRGIIPLFCWDGESTTPGVLFNVHGGITYSDKAENYPIENNKSWWFGFDCAHCDDAKDWEYLKSNFPNEVWKPIWEIEKRFPNKKSNNVIRSKEYAEQECKNLAEQIKCVESTY